MNDLIKISKISFVIAFLLFSSCVNEKFDIYQKVPKGTLLDMNLIKESNALFKSKSRVILMYDFTEKYSEEFNPHLMFFDDKKLVSSSYFLSENVYDYKENEVTAYLNNNRLKRKGIYRTDLPEGFKINYKKYKVDFPHGSISKQGVLENIEYNSSNNTVDFILKGGNINKNIPLYKITYNYNKEEITINNTYEDETREGEVFKVSTQILDAYFKFFL
jgi:hypothetical protein